MKYCWNNPNDRREMLRRVTDLLDRLCRREKLTAVELCRRSGVSQAFLSRNRAAAIRDAPIPHKNGVPSRMLAVMTGLLRPHPDLQREWHRYLIDCGILDPNAMAPVESPDSIQHYDFLDDQQRTSGRRRLLAILEEARGRMGVCKSKFAACMGISPATYSALLDHERQKRGFTVTTLIGIASALEEHPDLGAEWNRLLAEFGLLVVTDGRVSFQIRQESGEDSS